MSWILRWRVFKDTFLFYLKNVEDSLACLPFLSLWKVLKVKAAVGYETKNACKKNLHIFSVLPIHMKNMWINFHFAAHILNFFHFIFLQPISSHLSNIAHRRIFDTWYKDLLYYKKRKGGGSYCRQELFSFLLFFDVLFMLNSCRI